MCTFFPRAENVQHFATPFLKLMFAHANFEGVFREMQNVVANDEAFSKTGRTAGSQRTGQKKCDS